MNRLAQITERLPTGKGTVVLDGSKSDIGQFFKDKMGFSPEAKELNVIFQTPMEENTGHPFWDSSSMQAMRATNDLRSFYIPTPLGGSITVKGGDLPYMGQLLERRGFAPVRRIRNAQIPGGCLLTVAKNEFNAALDFHGMFLDVYGELAPTALPLRLHQVTHVRNKLGQLQDVRAYANSDEYVGPIDDCRRRELGLLDDERVGDALFDRYGSPLQNMYTDCLSQMSGQMTFSATVCSVFLMTNREVMTSAGSNIPTATLCYT